MDKLYVLIDSNSNNIYINNDIKYIEKKKKWNIFGCIIRYSYKNFSIETELLKRKNVFVLEDLIPFIKENVDTTKIKEYLEYNDIKDINDYDKYGKTLMEYAIDYNRKDVIKLLLEKGYYINTFNKNCHTAWNMLY